MLVFKFNRRTSLFEIAGTSACMEKKQGSYRPPVDISWFEGTFKVKMDLPGVSADDIFIQADDEVLNISGTTTRIKSPGPCRLMERTSGTFMRSIKFPVAISPDEVKATLLHGVLEITVPTTKKDRNPTRIEIRFEGSD